MKEDPAARPSGRRVPRSAKDLEEDARFGLASRTDPAFERTKIPDEINGPRKSFYIPGFCQGSKDRSRTLQAQYWMRQKSAQNSSDLGADGSYCSVSKDTVRTTSSVPGDPDQRKSCKPPFQPLSGKLLVGLKPLPYRVLSSRVIRGEQS